MIVALRWMMNRLLWKMVLFQLGIWSGEMEGETEGEIDADEDGLEFRAPSSGCLLITL
ncbi:hypothetical protein IMZ48_48715 [Candidatus Bathyarchaeota archaeon]|nr:hypothetical protein [Candidatus Bathyarchaeota archaeon]